MSITQTHFISQIESYFLVYCHYEYLYNSIVLRERERWEARECTKWIYHTHRNHYPDNDDNGCGNSTSSNPNIINKQHWRQQQRLERLPRDERKRRRKEQ